MKQMRCFLGLATAGWLCAGCLPLRVTTSPGASGTVVDANSLAPIRGAQVVVCRPSWNRMSDGRQPASEAQTRLKEAAYREAYPGATPPGVVRALLNRKLLEEAYPLELSRRPGFFGGGYYRNVGVVLLNPTGE